MDAFSTSKQWQTERFGASYDVVVDALRAAAATAHEKGVDAKDGSGLPSDDNYGVTYWQVLLVELMAGLRREIDVRDVRLTGGRYPLPEVNGTTILAARSATGSGPNAGNLRLKRSRIRDELLSNRSFTVESGAFDFSDWIENDVEIAFPDSESTAVVMAVVVAGPRTGVTRLYLGDGYLSSNGTVIWGHVEQISLGENARPAMNLVTEPTAVRFDDLPVDDDLDLGLQGGDLAREATSDSTPKD